VAVRDYANDIHLHHRATTIMKKHRDINRLPLVSNHPSTIVTDPPLPPLPDTTPFMVLAQPPHAMSLLTTTSKTATRTSPSATTQLQTPRKRRHTLPSRSIPPLQSPQPLVPHCEPPVATATSPPTTAATPAIATPETTARASSSGRLPDWAAYTKVSGRDRVKLSSLHRSGNDKLLQAGGIK
jgi:hypothetical protein